MKNLRETFKIVFPLTLPVLAGYMMLGMAYGILMSDKGFSIVWTFLMSAVVFAGALQYAAVTLLASTFNPLLAFLLALLVNIRHLFYGISMLDRFKGLKGKAFMIFGMADEAFSINVANEVPQDVDPSTFYLMTTGLCYLYWQLSCLSGHLLSVFIPDSIKGFDFVLTALFYVMFLNQWKTKDNRSYLLLGVLTTLIALMIFGKSQFLLGSMVFIILGLFALERVKGQSHD
ncbi:MAG: AzlC family ABC transporter permease [Erysipelotrichaceae bacterium]|nr:AzlC family ABC transporter permease [Erysipelotrichaceae bacterium]